MKLSRESQYAIEGLMVLARKPLGKPIQLREIAAAAKVPPSFLAKIFQKLNHAQIVISSRGAVRGYALAHQPDAIAISAVFAAVEGGDVFDRCIFWSDRCTDANPCRIHSDWVRIRESILRLMQQTTLSDLARKQYRKPNKARQQSRGGIP